MKEAATERRNEKQWRSKGSSTAKTREKDDRGREKKKEKLTLVAIRFHHRDQSTKKFRETKTDYRESTLGLQISFATKQGVQELLVRVVMGVVSREKQKRTSEF